MIAMSPPENSLGNLRRLRLHDRSPWQFGEHDSTLAARVTHRGQLQFAACYRPLVTARRPAINRVRDIEHHDIRRGERELIAPGAIRTADPCHRATGDLQRGEAGPAG